jgi:hypothetical protein
MNDLLESTPLLQPTSFGSLLQGWGSAAQPTVKDHQMAGYAALIHPTQLLVRRLAAAPCCFAAVASNATVKMLKAHHA